MKEEWKRVIGHEDYQVSNWGKIKSFKRYPQGKILSQRINQGGYFYINLCENGKYKSIQVHSLVAKHFVEGYSPTLSVNHKDCDKSNNKHTNLEWVTSKENLRHAFINGLVSIRKGSSCNLSKLKEKDILIIRRLRKRGRTHNKIARLYRMSRTNITLILSGKLWKHI